jgi:hypothetical protein
MQFRGRPHQPTKFLYPYTPQRGAELLGDMNGIHRVNEENLIYFWDGLAMVFGVEHVDYTNI